MQRRTFLEKTSLTVAGMGLLGSMTSPAVGKPIPTFRVNGARIESRIMELAKFGRDGQGRGYRIAYSQGDLAGREWFINLMKNAGLRPFIDAGGNIIGRRAGMDPDRKPIGFGSHIDMVPDGGNYDGTLGSIAALEVIEVLNENKWSTWHPLEVIIFANEEGGTIGSKAMTEGLTPEGLQQRSQSGLMMADGIKAIGGDPDQILNTVRKPGDFSAFFELHIEQGGILEREKIQIGVVEGIVGIVHWEVTVEGFANHAGATPMNMRQDALLAASQFVIAVEQVINSVPGAQVGTVGKMSVAPGAYNVIPGKVVLGLEIRDLSAEKIEMLFGEIEKKAAAIATASKTRITFARQPSHSRPALTDKDLKELVDSTAKSLGFTTKFMQSGAGHDSQHMANIAPVAMIFIPSIGGISHSPKEFSTTTDMTNGANVLLKTILNFDPS